MLNVRGQNVLPDSDVAMLYKCEKQELVKKIDRLWY